MLLGTSIAFVLGGLSIAVYDNAHKAGGMGLEGQTAIAFTISMCFSMAAYFVCWCRVEWRYQELLRENGL